MNQAAGIIRICSKQFQDANHEYDVEVHGEDAEAWYGYSRLNPFAGYQTFPKRTFTLVEDRRPEVKP